MRVYTKFLVSALTIAIAYGEDKAIVDFTVLDVWGRTRVYKVSRFQRLGGADIASEFTNLSNPAVPYGRYIYELVPVGVQHPFSMPLDVIKEKFSGQVDVLRQRVRVTRVGMTDFGSLASFPVEGMVVNLPPTKGPVWVMVESAYGDFHRHESSVDSHGNFYLDWIMGNNIVVVLSGTDVLLAAPAVAKWNEVVRHLWIDVKNQKVRLSP